MTELWREAVGAYTEMIPSTGSTWWWPRPACATAPRARFDDELEVTATSRASATTSMTTTCTIVRVGDGTLLAEGELRHVFVDPGDFAQAPDARAAYASDWRRCAAAAA